MADPRNSAIGSLPSVLSVSKQMLHGLKRRVEELESLQRANKHARLSNGPGPEATTHGHSASTVSAPANTQRSHQLQAADGGSTIRHALAEFGQLALSTTSTDNSESIRHFSLWQIVNAASKALPPASASGADVYDLRNTLRHAHQKQAEQPITFSRLTTSSFVQRYADTVLRIYPFMDRDRFLHDYEFVLSEHERRLSPHASPSQGHRYFLVYMAIATMATATAADLHISYFGSQLHILAMSMLRDTLAKSEPVTAVQCLVSLILKSLHCSDGGSTWQLLGITMAQAISIGLHRLSDEAALGSHGTNQDETHNVFWTLLLLDRTVSDALGRPYAIQDQDITTARPPGQESYVASNGKPPSLLAAALEHCYLVSESQQDPWKPDIYFLTIADSWSRSTSVSAVSPDDEHGAEQLSRLEARYLICACRKRLLITNIPHSPDKGLGGRTISACWAWLHLLEAQCMIGTALLTTLDVYEITRAAVVSALIAQQLARSMSNELLADVANIRVLAMSLLSFATAKFGHATEFRNAVSLAFQYVPPTLQSTKHKISEPLSNTIETGKVLPRSLRKLLSIARTAAMSGYT
ncbi:hypothetical protein LTR15_001788 [Elasticomyces elasticus]|nr:hypothetical protein LTR15_001788 [Elasticomyces elasticus]